MTDEGCVAFEITGIQNGATTQLMVNDTGETISLSQEIGFNKLPPHVRQTLKVRHGKGKFSTISKVTTTIYVATWHDRDGEHEVDVDASGLRQYDSDEEAADEDSSFSVMHTSGRGFPN
jgi:hypothetical protein